MADDKGDTRKLVLMALLALWLAAYGYSIIFALSAPAEGSGFTRGMNRIAGFSGWQGVAGILAFGCWGLGWSFARGSGIRRISVVPMWMALAVILAIVGWVVFNLVRA